MKPLIHIRRLLRETGLIQRHGHCVDGPSFVAINDIEIAIHELRKAFEIQEESGLEEKNTPGRDRANSQ